MNGFYIHHSVLPFMKRRLGRRLFSSLRFAQGGTVHIGGQHFVCLLGRALHSRQASELNYVTPMWEIMVVYGSCVAAMRLDMFTLAANLTKLQTMALSAAARSVPESAHWENAECVAVRQKSQRLPTAPAWFQSRLDHDDDEIVMTQPPRVRRAA